MNLLRQFNFQFNFNFVFAIYLNCLFGVKGQHSLKILTLDVSEFNQASLGRFHCGHTVVLVHDSIQFLYDTVASDDYWSVRNMVRQTKGENFMSL